MEHQKSWWDYFSEDPYEKIGRHVTGAFGQTFILEMPRISWAYLDWLSETENADFQQFFMAQQARACIFGHLEERTVND